MKVYLLQHAYDYGEDLAHSEIKTLGVYESIKSAERAINRYKCLPGFREYSDDCFHIDEYTINKGTWTEGFITV